MNYLIRDCIAVTQIGQVVVAYPPSISLTLSSRQIEIEDKEIYIDHRFFIQRINTFIHLLE